MTVSSTNTKNSYSGDGSVTVFAYTFKIFDDDDISVILRTDATGTETVQTKNTHYSVSGVGDAGGGNITFVTAPAVGETVVLIRQTVQTQTTDYTPNDPFPAESHENALDKLTLIIQDVQEEVDRSIKLSRTNTMTSTEFTVGSSDRADKVLAFDSSGELSVAQELGVYRGDWSASTAFAVRDLIKDTTNDNIYICQTAHTSSGSLPISTNADASKWELIVDAATATSSATAAAASATAAAASETAAAASETSAAASETAAAASESAAATSETNAASSASTASTAATNAATSETNAATSETNAATSATAAASSATSAASSASTATTKASEASTSATNAATSASSASSSATAAATSATNASNSATSAASSASAAATSATAAEAARDAIEEFYLGAQSSNPTVDGNGDPVTAGDWYFNTTDNTTRIYDGSAWNTVSPDLVGDTTPQLGGNLDTNGNDITFGDNDKAIFGAGSDLQIYHDGTHSKIQDTGTGDLLLMSDGANVRILKNSAETLAAFNTDGSVNLYYDNSKKFETTSGGIDVTGTVTADAATIDNGVLTVNDAGTRKVEISGNGFSDFTSNPVLDGGIEFTNQFGHVFSAGVSNSNNFDVLDGATKIARFSGGGDVSLYDSSGVSQGFFWDASTQRLGLGSTSPTTTLDVTGTVPADGLTVDGGGSRSYFNTAHVRLSDDYNLEWGGGTNYVRGSNASNYLLFATNSSEAMRITSGGNVGINTTSPATLLHTKAGSNSTTDWTFTAQNSAGSAVTEIGGYGYNHNLYHRFWINDSEIARFDSSGNLIVGKTSPSLSIAGSYLQYDGFIGATRDGNACFGANRLTSDGDIMLFQRSGTTVGSISVTGSGTTYNTTSDIRLKTDIAPIADATDKLMAMNAVTHKWKAEPDADAVVGFIAQEMAEIVPEAVSKGEGENDMWSMDYGRITPVLVAALQDAHRKIEQLEQRIADMEAK